MSNEHTIEDCLLDYYAGTDGIEKDVDNYNRLLSELRTLRAEAEAWRAVVGAHAAHNATALYMVVSDQIARLDAMKSQPAPHEGEEG